MMHIVNPDGTRKPVLLNHPFVAGPNGQPQMVDPRMLSLIETQGTIKTVKQYNVRQGRYDVSVSTGPSYQSRRQEASMSMIEFIKAYPQAGPIVGDLVAGNMDWPGAADFAERLKKLLPPQLQDNEQGGPQINPQQAMAMVQGLQQQIGQLTQLLQGRTIEKRLELASRERIATADRASKERIADKQAMAHLIGEAERAHSAQADRMAQLDFAATEHRLNLAHERELAQTELDNELMAAEADRQHAIQEQAQDQQHEMNMAQGQQAHEQGLAADQQAHEQSLQDQQQQFQAQQPAAAPGKKQ
jgi:hypothetical protein